ncbi:PREDICTED: uncharacterized protein LOC106338940 [Brassica oleracea var. oleracea]|uniref:uncharacterized protein LOC106338940 n=1 Tax=Brassica oleracea var. oleracea TaxID=109376 RepID=UPI0006A6CBB2|nr:PREDICTED: uncharacterized protein LOC106338940 [Brassica oleracea var. oleracea]
MTTRTDINDDPSLVWPPIQTALEAEPHLSNLGFSLLSPSPSFLSGDARYSFLSEPSQSSFGSMGMSLGFLWCGARLWVARWRGESAVKAVALVRSGFTSSRSLAKATIMQATINANRLSSFRERLSAGTMYSISGFDVARCAQNFKLTDSSLMIRFNDSTEFDVLTDPVSPLPVEGFRFRNQTELVGLANTNNQLPDIIGEISVVKSTVSEPPEDKNRVMVTVKLESDVSVTLSLFDCQAVLFHKKLEGMRDDPKVIVATNINPKMIGGRLFLNATSGTHVYFDKETNARESFLSVFDVEVLVARDTGLTPAAPLLRAYAKVESMTIAELNNFVITAPSQEIDFLCTGRVSSVDADKGWCYVACSKCSRKLQRSVAAFECARCNSSHAVGSLRYRVEMVVADETAEGTFVCFDGVMKKLHNLRASEAGQMLAEEGVNPEDSIMPPFIADMDGKTYTFQVRVTAYNFTVNHQSFTVSRIINEIERVPAPEFVDNVGDDDDDDDDDDKPDVKKGQGKSASGDGVCEASKNAVKDPVRNAHKKARVA